MAIQDILNIPLVRNLTQSTLLSMDAEVAHKITIQALRMGAAPTGKPDPAMLQTTIAGLKLPNPLGIAAGFDKNAQAHETLSRLGLGFVEVGTVTPRPQSGNPKPRVFRLRSVDGVINRMGFNNDGHAAALDNIRFRQHSGVLGVNIGANKDSEDFVEDYIKGVKTFSAQADYLTANISSPNTPGLRNLQSDEALTRLLGAIVETRSALTKQTPIFLKIAPDLSEAEMDDVARVVLASGIDGLIVSNTTLSRDVVAGLPNATEAGGLSGKPIFNLSTQKLAQMRQRVGKDFPLIGVGGIHSAASAIAKFEAGANAIQIYSALAYGGLTLIEDIKNGITDTLVKRHLTSVEGLTSTAVDDWASGKITL